MRVGLVALEGCFGAGAVAILDVLGTADALRAEVDPSIPPIEVRIVATRRRVTTSSGVILPASAPLRALDEFDLVIVGALGTLGTEDTLAALGAPDTARLVSALRVFPRAGATLAAACTGSFALAEAGLLDGGRATTSWWLGPAFRARYPAVELDLESMVVADGRIVTAGAAFAHIDLALALLRRSSPALAELVSRVLVIDDRPSQSGYLTLDHLEHDDPVVRAFEGYARAHLGAPIDVATAAHAIGVSRRTLERRVSARLGLSPIALVQRLRVERARHLMRTTGESADQVAARVGYRSGSTLRALLRRSREAGARAGAAGR